MTTPTVPPTVETLLAHREWLRSLARALARDESAADDLEQDVWLDAVRSPPRDAASPRGWLARVLRRNAVDSGRSDRRRSAREAAVARPPTIPAPQDAVARTEIESRAVAAVLALDEPSRSAVILRFVEGLEPAEIAARLDVPVETVRTRIRRGLQSLRARLDAAHDGDRRRWLALLVPAAQRRAPVGGLVAAVAVVVVVCSAAATTWIASGGAPSDSPDPAADDAAAPTPHGGAADAQGTRPARLRPPRVGRRTETAPADDFDPVPPGTWVAVYVMDEDGRPLRDATVDVRGDAGAPSELASHFGAHGVAAANPLPLGGFPAAAEAEVVTVSAHAPGRPRSDRTQVTLDESRTQSVRIVLPAPREARVVVVDDRTGAPVAGAVVAAISELDRQAAPRPAADAPSGPGWATTDERGRATIGGLTKRRHVFTARARLCIGASVTAAVADGAPEVRIAVRRIESPGTARVTVRGARGAPVASSVVRCFLHEPQWSFETTTDSNGVADIAELAPGRWSFIADVGAVLRGAPPDDANARVRITSSCIRTVDLAPHGRVEVVLGDDGTTPRPVRFRVTGPDGAPRAGVPVAAEPFAPSVTDAAGEAAIVGPRDTDAILARIDGWFAAIDRDPGAPERPIAWTTGDVRVQLAFPGAGTAEIWCADRWTQVQVGPDGRASVPAFPSGPATIEFLRETSSGTRFGWMAIDVPAGGFAGPLDVALREHGTLRVRGAARTASFRLTRVGARPAQLWYDTSATVASHASGPLVAGTWTLHMPDGTTRTVEIPEGGLAEIDLSR